MKTLAAVAVISALAVAGCARDDRVWACATDEARPIVHAEAECPQDRSARANGLRWYGAAASDIDEDDTPIVGEELDGDFWNWKDQIDYDEKKMRKSTVKPASPKPKTTAKNVRR